jgi:Kdo-III transferase WaaZ
MPNLKSDRPLMRSIIKLASTVLFGRAWAHAQSWLPGLELRMPETPDETGTIIYKSASVGRLYHAGLLRQQVHEMLVIIGSGPSISDIDFGKLKHEGVILLNGAISLAGERLADPLAVAIEDERFVWRHFALMRDKISPNCICLLSVGVIRAICEQDQNWLADKKVVIIDDLRKPYRLRRREDKELRTLDFAVLTDAGSGFSLDPSRGVFQGGSVAVSALQFAAYCQPQSIGLFGIDISNARDPRFYERAGDVAGSRIADAADRIVAHLTIARKVCVERDIEIRNYSPVSALIGAGFSYDPRFAAAKAASD